MATPQRSSRAAINQAVQARYYRRPTVLPPTRRGIFWSPPQLAEALHPEGVTAADLAALLAVALAALAKQSSPEAIADEVEANVPLFADVKNHFRTGAGQIQTVQWLVTTIIALLALLKPAAPIEIHVESPPAAVVPVPTPEEIARIAAQTLVELEREEAAGDIEPSPSAETESPSVGQPRSARRPSANR